MAALLPAGTALTGCKTGGGTPGKADGEPGGWDFDEVINREGTGSIKYGRATDGEIPMWIADMDFRTAPEIVAALRDRAEHGIYGYTALVKLLERKKQSKT